MELNVLLVEDDLVYLKQLERDLPDLFQEYGIEVKLHPISDFDEALSLVKCSHVRFDLVISDTYKGAHKDRNAAVMKTVAEYRSRKFCPLIVCSSGERPPNFESTTIVQWVDKTLDSDLNDAIVLILNTGIPQIAKQLHDELDSSAGNYLWDFLEKNWLALNEKSPLSKEQLARLVRRRIATKISDLKPDEYAALNNRHGLEYYIYPALQHDYFSLGDIVQNKEEPSDIRVILTPHCHLIMQNGADAPRAEFVLTIKAMPANDVLGTKIDNVKANELTVKLKKLRKWANSPAQTERKPEGRHWYLPQFLKIPHLFCDFLQVNSIEYKKLKDEYTTLATLSPPYAEAMQECFSSFYGSVGIPNIEPNSILDLLA